MEPYLFKDFDALVDRLGQADQCRDIVSEREADEFSSRVLEKSF